MKKRVLGILSSAMLISVLLFTGCSNVSSTSSSGSRDADTTSSSMTEVGLGVVTGCVLDNAGNPIEGALVTLGSKTATTNAGGGFEIKDISINDKALVSSSSSVVSGSNTTAYSVTATKEGYLPATVTGVYVSYEEIESDKSAEDIANLTALYNDYYEILLKYAESIENGGTSADTTVGVSTDNTVTTTTTSTGVDGTSFNTLATALSDIKTAVGDATFYKQYFSTFANATLIPLTASFSGRVKLNLTTEGATVIDANTYFPTSNPIVRATYLPAGRTGFYSYETTVDENGYFKFEKLPAGVDIYYSMDAFFETINEKEYCFSTLSGTMILENTLYDLNMSIASNSAHNEGNYVFMLYAQNDKIWVTETNVDTTSTGVLLTTTDDLTFTFNKEMKSLELSSSTGINLSKTEYTLTWSEDKKTATIKPVAGYWTVSGDVELCLSGEAEDGSTTFLNDTFSTYFDTKVWISISTETLDDYNDRLKLSDSIVIVFSKAMNDKIALNLSNVSNAYNEEWSEDKKQLTLTPVNTYWDVSGTEVLITVAADGASSSTYYNTEFGYWKNGAGKSSDSVSSNDCLKVFFDNYVDVSLADATTESNEAFTVTFNKALKSFTKLDNIEYLKAGDTVVTDYNVAFDDTKKIVTISSKDSVFNKKGNYTIKLKDIAPVDGSKLLRKAGTLGSNTTLLEYTTDFAFDGNEFKPLDIEVIDALPDTAELSRELIAVTTDKVLKITFNKEVQKSELTVNFGNSAVSVKNYIDSEDSKIVYIPLDEADKVNSKIVIGGNVTAVVDTVDASNNHSDQAVFNTTNLEKWFDYQTSDYYIYAALNLEGTSLLSTIPHVTGNPEYKKADPITVGSNITFDFDADLTGCTASYKIFGLKDVDNGTAPDDIELLVSDGSATVSGKTVTVRNSAFAAKKTLGDIATYYLELRINNEDGVKIFSSTSPYFGTVADSFEETVKNNAIYDAPAATNPNSTPNNNKNYGSFIVEVAEKDILKSTNLISVETTALNTSVYSTASALAAKSAITFTFNDSVDLTGASAKYELYDLATGTSPAPQVISSDSATISGKVVTVQDDLLVSGNPKVTGKTFNVNTDSETGISTYYLKLEVKDSAGTVIYSSANKWLDSSYNSKITDFEKALSNIVNNNMFKISVAPLAIENLSFVEENVDSFGIGLKTYKTPAGINPKGEISIKFNSKIPSGAKYSYVINDGSSDVDKSADTGITLNAESDTITIQSDKMLASSSEVKTYKISLKIKNGDDVIFDTANAYFGKASDYEKAMSESAISAIDNANDVINVKVLQTKIIRETINNVESVTTKTEDFQKSFKTPIVLQFSHPVTGYKAVIYQTAKLYTDVTGSSHDLTDLNDSTKVVKYDDFVKESAEYIFASTSVISKNVITITPTNFFDVSTTINIAIFGEGEKYLYNLVDDSNNTVSYTTLTNTSANKIKLVNEMLSNAASLTAAAPAANGYIGNNQDVALSIDTTYSSKSNQLPTYELYLKKAEGSDYESVNSNAIAKDKKLNGNNVTLVNTRLGRAEKSYFNTSLPSDACDYWSETPKYASYVLLKKLDGVITAFKTSDTKMADSIGPELKASESASTDPNLTNIAFTSLSGNGVESTSTASTLYYRGVATDTFALKTGTDSPTEITGGFTMTLTLAEVVKNITVEYQGSDNANATGNVKTSKGNATSISYDETSKIITVTFKASDGKAYIYAEDVIDIKLTDVSGNESSYNIGIMNATN
ncbi:MAG: carboxypeptidase-like regulatory domain-containing protein [Treponema sp.]|nr:carboxypeptidase-like regulatory domain-containing protein [Treponema sp.]